MSVWWGIGVNGHWGVGVCVGVGAGAECLPN